MKSVSTTITSKNQITIPAKIIREMKLSQSRKMQIKRRGNSIVLTPLPSLSESLARVWEKAGESIEKPLSDKEINESIRNIAANLHDKT